MIQTIIVAEQSDLAYIYRQQEILMNEKSLEYDFLDSFVLDSVFCVERDPDYDPERAMWGEAVQY